MLGSSTTEPSPRWWKTDTTPSEIPASRPVESLSHPGHVLTFPPPAHEAQHVAPESQKRILEPLSQHVLHDYQVHLRPPQSMLEGSEHVPQYNQGVLALLHHHSLQSVQHLQGKGEVLSPHTSSEESRSVGE